MKKFLSKYLEDEEYQQDFLDELFAFLEQNTVKDEVIEEVKDAIVVCTVNTRYDVVKDECKKVGFQLSEVDDYQWDLYWCDTRVQQD